MNRTIAGAYGAGSAAGELDSGRLVHTVEATRPVLGSAAEGLLLAATGEAPTPSGDLICLLDGHVYNLVDLCARAGVPRALDEEEALATLFRRQGEGLFGTLRGDFVLVFWHRHERRGWLVRDQIGNRSLYFTTDGGRTLFASRIDHLLQFLRTRPGPDETALSHWLAFSGMPGERTLYAGISRLRPGHMLPLAGEATRQRRYWIPRYSAPLTAPRADLVDELRSRVQTAVRLRTAGPRETAVMLSGGLDSASVAAAGSDISRAYSATFPDHPSVDESALIDVLTDRLELDSTRIEVSAGSPLAGALEYLRHWQLPPSSPNLFFWFPLLRAAAADGVTVMLDGEGGDEILSLAPYLMSDRIRRGRLWSAVSLARRIPGAGPRPPWRSVLRITRNVGIYGAVPYGIHEGIRRRRGAAQYAPGWLAPQSAQAYFDTDDPWSWKRIDGPRWWAERVGLLTGIKTSLGYDHTQRRASQAGLETRHPIADVDVIELTLAIPPELLYDWRYSRPLIREAMRGLMPDEVRLRPSKSFFNAIFHEGLAGPDLDLVRELVTGADAHVREYVDVHAVERDLLGGVPAAYGERAQWAVEVWRLATAECWLRQLADPTFAGRVLDSGRLTETRYRWARRPAGQPVARTAEGTS